ncbi:MAG: hypothetical protein AAFY72_03360 [Cyanobacteria bacterium J06649_4]
MYTSNLKLARRFLIAIAPLCLLASCASSSTLASDDALLAQWNSEKSQLLSLVESCASGLPTYDLAERYLDAEPLIPTDAIEMFVGCEVPADSELQLEHLAKLSEGEAYLFVRDRDRRGTGVIEESVSKWTSGWISWKSTIWEEKGFVYVAGEITNLQGLRVSELRLPRMSISPEPLDPLSGKYRVTSQVSGNGCEVWRLRPSSEPGWYLFYRQVRECAV